MIPIHQWTHDGDEVLIVRQCQSDGTSSHGFRYPLRVGERVEAPDWNPEPIHGNGLHGWPWGLALGDGQDPDYAAVWLVLGARPDDVIDLGGRVKCRAATVRHVGEWHTALAFVLSGQMAWAVSSSTGDDATSSSTGHRATSSSTGDGVASSSAGDCAASSSTGHRAVSSSTGHGAVSSSTGDRAVAVCAGLASRARAGAWGCIALAWWNEATRRTEMHCARVGCGDGSDGLLKAGVWYVLDAGGEFIEVTR